MRLDIRQRATNSIVRRLLRPAAQIAVRSGMSFRELAHLLKLELLQASEEELLRSEKKISASKLSAATGLNRNDIRALKEAPEETSPLSSSLVARILNRWEQDKRFHDRRGRPRVLTISGANNEFERLVSSVSSHIASGAVLFELLRSGQAVKTARGLRLQNAAALSSKDKEAGLDLLARNVDSLCTAVFENLTAGEMKNVHLRTTYNNIYVGDLERIRKWLLEEAKRFHKRMRKMLSKSDADLSPRATVPHADGATVIVGTFSLTVPPTGDRK